MELLQHDLLHEFPEHANLIQELRSADGRFAKLLDEYDAVDGHVRHIEEYNEPVTDVDMEILKKQRLHLKDELWAIIRASATGRS